MSNVLKVNEQQAIQSLWKKGWSQRKIAQELGLNRRTVSRYAGKRTGEATAESGSKCTTQVTPGSSRAKSACESHREEIARKVEAGLSAQRIYQDLVSERGFASSYQSVKRFVSVLRAKEPRRVWRMESLPGEEVQVDFGLGAMIEESAGKRRRSWVLRAVLSHSRKGYSEAVYRQDTETFLRVLENAFRHFGGVPLVLNLDNLKAAVLKADWYDPEINPKLAEFCRHYGVNVVPCRPATPQHKGKVERGVAYVRTNALKGRRFATLEAENAHLAHWESQVADKRVHGTTCKQVAALFAQEREHLQPLPASLFPCYQEGRRTVGRDSFVEVAKSFYQVPPEYIGRQVWVRWDGRVVRILSERLDQVQIHTRIEPGKFSRSLGTGGHSRPVIASCRYWVERISLLGSACQQWGQVQVENRGPEALRSLMGLWSLRKTHSSAALDAACRRAQAAGACRLKDIKRLLAEPASATQMTFTECHPLIRELTIYGDFITHYAQNAQNPSPQTAPLWTP